MQIILHKHFEKGFSKLTANQKKHLIQAIELFKENPYHPQLDNHALHGDFKGKRSISVGGDLRVVFVEKNNYEFVHILRVGSHSQLY